MYEKVDQFGTLFMNRRKRMKSKESAEKGGKNLQKKKRRQRSQDRVTAVKLQCRIINGGYVG